MTTGLQIKNAIKGAGFTMEEAASKIGISRNHLYYHINKGIADNDFVITVREKLGINIVNDLARSHTNDFAAGINEPAMIADALKDRLIKSQQQTIDALNGRIEDLNRTIQTLLNDIQRLSKETVVQQHESTGKRRSA